MRRAIILATLAVTTATLFLGCNMSMSGLSPKNLADKAKEAAKEEARKAEEEAKEKAAEKAREAVDNAVDKATNKALGY
ncbi:hypothetical protein [Helicobacter felis]|uniref:hypothetical protein n=1 Tax=Helicobacter felis TaxID=214 RepID=UPI000CEEA8E5|nr:hypothetical protein [Helicobacter felis]